MHTTALSVSKDTNSWAALAYFRTIALDIDDPTKPETWKFQIFMGLEIDIKPEDDSPAKRVQLVKAAGKAFVEPFRSGVEWMPEDTYISPDRYGTWETRKWDSKGGKVILAGDAAHGMTAREFSFLVIEPTISNEYRPCTRP